MFKYFHRDKRSVSKREHTGKKEHAKEPEHTGEMVQIPCMAPGSAEVPFVEVSREDLQQVLRGSRKRFSERIDNNLAIMSRRLPTGDLVCESIQIGTLAPKKIVLVYLKNTANPGIVSEVKDRVRAIKSPAVIDSSYIERNIEDSGFSPFPQLEVTQKPDATESALLQGRVGVFLDGSPDVLLAPTTFFDLMDTTDDAYTRWFVAGSFFRLARYIMFILAVSLPGFYIALTSYNPEMIPTKLLFLSLGTREETAYPIYFEAFLMMGVIEAIRMMMIRIPSQIGSTIAVVSGITLVAAGMYSNILGASVIIIATLTMIASFGIPSYDLRSAVRIIQFFTMILSAFLGIFGYAAAFFYIAIHLATLKSFGIPYLAPLAPTEGSGWGHTVLRENTVSMPQDETYKPLRRKQTRRR